MDKKAVMAMGMVFLLWMLYFTVFAPKPQPAPNVITPPGESGSVTRQNEEPVEYASSDIPGEDDSLLSAMSETESSSETVELEPVDTIVVTTDLYQYHFVSRGGILVRAYLKEYPSFSEDKSEAVGENQSVQLIPAKDSRFLASRLLLQNQKRNRMDFVDLAERNFQVSTTKLTLDSRRDEGSVTFTSKLQGGRELKLVYIFRNDSYKIDAYLSLPGELRRSEENMLEVTLGPTLISNEKNPEDDYTSYGIVYGEQGGGIVNKSLKDLSKSDWSPTEQPAVLWGGIKSKYFLTIFHVPQDPMVSVSASGSLEDQDVTFRGRFSVPQSEKPLHYSVYLGPQSYDQIHELNWGLEKILEYGWPIVRECSKACLWVMLWMHKYIENYGIVLILFALLVRVVFHPLTTKSTKSMIKMQKIQPLMTELKEKYKDDPQKMQQETMRLYKEHKVSPLGGCLPMLIQMPVFFGLFMVFRLTIEFRGAEGFWWIHDLSQPDPLYIWPVVMGLSSFLQQKLTPTQADPKMKPMLYLMPVFMVYIFLKLSAGLVMYYNFFNFFQIFQQLYINWRYHGEALPRKKASVAGSPAPGSKAAKSAAAGAARKKKNKGSRK
jgi:YidC/Oxa1 family membrane protein insertase